MSAPTHKRPWWFWVFVFCLMGIVVLFAFRKPLFRTLIQWKLVPKQSFASMKPPPAPDYQKTNSWAALPHTKDFADYHPKGTTLASGSNKPNVFFVHPTTYLSNTSWNAPLGSAPKAKARVDSAVMKHQASAFNGCCDIYAPRYRQATLGFALKFEPDGKQALALAYQDVVRAFRVFLRKWNKDKPFFLAGHSQGAIHALRLLEEHIAHTPLRHKLIAAYIVGNPVHKDKFKRGLKHLHPCQHPTDTGCVASWMTLGPKGNVRKYSRLKKWYAGKGYEDVSQRKHICTNPISFINDGGKTTYKQHLGSVRFRRGKAPMASPKAHTVKGSCQNGAMVIERTRLKRGYNNRMLGPDDYHIYDFNLFYMNIRHNAIQRAKAYRKAHPTTRTPPPTTKRKSPTSKHP
jgi:pimeloyl-ACP methyl ester carboxylesterase